MSVLQQITYPATAAGTPTLKYLYEIDPQVQPLNRFALTGVIDENGSRYATWTYDTSGRATSSEIGATGSGIGKTTISYDDMGNTRTVTNALGRQFLYSTNTIEAVLRLKSIADNTTGAAKSYAYDGNGYVNQITDQNGNVTTYVNDGQGRPLTTTEAAGTAQQRVTTNSYLDPFNVPQRIVGPLTTTNFTYDSSGNLLTRAVTDTLTGSPTNGQTRTWTYTWANSLVASTQGPRTDVTELTQYQYDTHGDLKEIKNALGQKTEITNLPSGRPLTIVDPNGLTTNLTYDGRGRLLTSTVQADTALTTSYTYDLAGNLAAKTLPDGAALYFGYDAAHRLYAINTADLQQIVYILDARGDRTQTQTFQSGVVKRSETAAFDTLGRLVQTTGGAGQRNSYGYDNNGNVTGIIDGNGNPTVQVYDALNRLIQVRQYPNWPNTAPATTVLTYNPADQVASLTDANGNQTVNTYDGFGDLIQVHSPDSGTTAYTYNADGLPTQRTDAAGTITNYAYDALDRTLSRSYPGNAAENIGYAYDQGANGIGRLVAVSDPAGSLTRSYNTRGLLASQTRTLGPTALTTGYTYDLANRVQSIAYPSGLIASYTRDGQGRVTAVNAQQGAGGTPNPVVSGVSYAPFGPITGLTYGEGTAEARALDQAYRLTQLATTPLPSLQNLIYAYDAADNVTAITDGTAAANNQTFTYDGVNRLVGANGGYGAFAWGYDAVGNRIGEIATPPGGSPASRNYSYWPQTNRLASVTAGGGGLVHSMAYGYTGTLSADQRPGGLFQFAYNQADRVSFAYQNGGAVGQYLYDAFGQRTFKWALGGGTTEYVYDEKGHLIEEAAWSANGAVPTADYIYLGDRPVGLYVPGQSLYFYHDDRLGTPQVVTGSHQNPVWIANYQPFGAASIIAAITQNLRMPGQYFDSETGWSHNGWRTYAPDLGRYVEPDPIGFAGGINMYLYAGANPLKNIDPGGEQLWIFEDFINAMYKKPFKLPPRKQIPVCDPKHPHGMPDYSGPPQLWSGPPQPSPKNEEPWEGPTDVPEPIIMPGPQIVESPTIEEVTK